jgi:cell division protein ZapE
VGGGRLLHVPKSLKGVAVFSFKAVWRGARGQRLSGRGAGLSYGHSGRHPRLGKETRNEAARFVTLIDALYEHKVKLFVTADAPLDRLYDAGDKATDTGSFELTARSAD